jgi:NitT/TauT family transport system ATP-binding protein
LKVEDLTLQYKTKEHLVAATYRVSFDVFPSDRLVVLGPSGCGKSTLLKAVGGYIPPVEGRILLEGSPVKAPGRDRVFVFQEFDQLLPWKTVLENIIFALMASGQMKRPEAKDRALHALERVHLAQFVDRYPHTLSGGMKQRAAIARAMAVEPRVLLMDEPFAALDALTRSQMQEELLDLWQETKFTVLFVTHSIPEAIRVGSRVLLLSSHPGQVKEEIASTGADLPGPDGKLLSTHIRERLFDGAMRAGEGTHA